MNIKAQIVQNKSVKSVFSYSAFTYLQRLLVFSIVDPFFHGNCNSEI